MLVELAAAPLVVAIAGDASKLDLAKLRTLGDVSVITPSQLVTP